MPFRRLALAGTAFLVSAASADQIDDHVRRTMRESNIPGVVVLIAKNGRPVRISTYGVSNVELKTPVRKDTAFEIGSVSKQFTAAAVLLLAEEGKLSLDDPVGKHLPDAPERWRPLTLRQILSHTAGLKDTMQTLDDPKFRASEYVTKMGPLALDFEPGTSWSYSNMGFNLAAMVVEEVGKEKFSKFMQTRVFSPLGLTHTRFTDPDAVVANRAHGYVMVGKDLKNTSATYPATAVGAGSILSTVEDMARWNQAILDGKFLKPASIAEFVRPTRLKTGSTVPYALGWFIHQDGGRVYWEHGGNTMGFSCSNMVLPTEKASIIVLTNISGLGASTVTRRIAADLYPSFDLARRPVQPDPDPRSTARLFVTFRRFARGEYRNLEAFSPSMQGTLSSVRGSVMRMGLSSIGRDIKRYHHIDSEKLPDGHRLSRYALSAGRGTVYIQITWTPEGLAEDFQTLYRE